MPYREPRTYYTYIVASRSRVLYVGITNDLTRRVAEHKSGEVDGFTKLYRVNRLVYYEEFANPSDAIAREKEMKRWLRSKKVELIRVTNPDWRDLSEEWE